MLKTCFLSEVRFIIQISKRSTCAHLHHAELDSVGQSHLKTVATFLAFPAYPKTTWCEDSAALYDMGMVSSHRVCDTVT